MRTRKELIEEIELIGLGTKAKFKFHHGGKRGSAYMTGQLKRTDTGFIFQYSNGRGIEGDTIQDIKNGLTFFVNETVMNLCEFEIIL